MEHLSRLENEAPSILEEKDEIDVFLSPFRVRKERESFEKDIKGRTLLSKSDSGSLLLNQQDTIEVRSPRGSVTRQRDSASFVLAPVSSTQGSPVISKHTHIKRHQSDDGKLKKSLELSRSANAVPAEGECPSIDAMKRYRELDIPGKGQEVEFRASEYLNPISFSRPFFDEEEELFAEWGLPLTLATISFSTLCEFISAILLEKKILVYADSLRILSALV